jgi:hypothetical protein
MGLEPTNLLTASQALYQLSYAPVVGLVAGQRHFPFTNIRCVSDRTQPLCDPGYCTRGQG